MLQASPSLTILYKYDYTDCIGFKKSIFCIKHTCMKICMFVKKLQSIHYFSSMGESTFALFFSTVERVGVFVVQEMIIQ